MATDKKKKPLSNGPERDNRGKFLNGNSGGPGGNPHAKKAAVLRAALYKAVTEKDIKEVVAKMIRQARNGDAAARKELFDRLWGKAAQPLNLGDADGEPLELTVNVAPPNNK